jgi:hypothetical protein
MGEIASLKAELAQREAMLPAFRQKAFEELTEAMKAPVQPQAQPEPESEPEAVPKAAKRSLDELLKWLPLYSPLYIESRGDRWNVRFARNDKGEPGFFDENEVFYTSPAALSKAHASRMTEAHPSPTKPGNGWEHIRLAYGTMENKSIGDFLNEYRTEH